MKTIDQQTYRRRLGRAVAAAVVCALAVLAAAVATIASGSATAAGPFNTVMVAIVVMIAARMMLHLRIGQVRITQSLTDTAMMLGLITLHWSWLVIVVAAGVTVARTHAGMPARQITYLSAKDVITVAAATGVGMLIGLGGSPFYATVSRLPALLVVAGTMLVVDEVMTIPVRALVNQQPVWATFTNMWHIRIGGSIVRLVIAVGAGTSCGSTRASRSSRHSPSSACNSPTRTTSSSARTGSPGSGSPRSST